MTCTGVSILLSFLVWIHQLQVQAHGSDAMVDEENCVFFLPHRPRTQICEPPFFLFMKGTGKKKGSCPLEVHARHFSISSLALLIYISEKFPHAGWCGAGADHYEPLIAHPLSFVSQEKVAMVL